MGATSHFVVSKTDHPGSTRQEIENEPNWGSGHNHRVGFKNKDNRVPGYVEQAKGKLSAYHARVHHGDLVNFEDVINAQEDLSLSHPENRSVGWRYVLNTTEEWVKYGQKWPANVEAEKKKQQKAAEQRNGEDKRDSAIDPPQHQINGKGGQKTTQDDKGRPEENYSPEELALLRALEHESEYVKNLEINDGKRESPQKNHRQPVAIDEADQFTPDNWLPRSPELIRLTGKHPLNAEPPLANLLDAGLVTPNELHYVRNHGAVPRLLWEFHCVDVEHGRLVLTMDQLKNDFDAANIPVLLACDGNRRKELNLIRQSKGFNWGAGGASCAYWKGALLRDVLLAAEALDEEDGDRRRRWVNFEGADELSEGRYSTCLPLDYVLDPTNDVLLAYEMNDAPLPPDHGYPVRLVVPGYVGGRSVKWLRRVWLSERESESHYHVWDNRVLPSFVTSAEGALAEAMFRHPSTACNEQNLNSVVVRPGQGERIGLAGAAGSYYRVRGFAYAGGGHEVQRVEASLDGGETWLYCIREFPGAPIRHGKKFWTWLHWHVDVPVARLLRAEEVRVRCFDAFKNTQPERPAWNLMGMMNNCWYTVKSEVVEGPDADAACVLFRHPVEPGAGDGGWMKPSVESRVEAAERNSGTPQKQFTREEIERHDKEDDCWIVVGGKVYDATSVMAWHPGGKAPIMAHAGRVHQETTDEYDSIHDGFASEKLKECLLGVVTDKAMNFIKKNAEKAAMEKAKDGTTGRNRALQKHKWIPTKLVDRKQLSDDTFAYTFRLPDRQAVLGLGTCQHVFIGFHLQDKMLVRSYTPTRPILPAPEGTPARVPEQNGRSRRRDDEHGPADGDGTFELVVKTYLPDARQPGGAMSNILRRLPVGGEVEVRGPTGEITYEGGGRFLVDGEEKACRRVSLVLGGSGVTPGYALVARIAAGGGGDGDGTEVRVVDANKTEKDILLRAELDGLAKRSGGKIEITHVLSHAEESWTGLKGYVDGEVLKEHLFPPAEDSAVFLCGPPAMIREAVLPALKDWGYEEDKNIFGF